MQWHPTPALLPRKSHGQRSLVGCSPWGCWESDTIGQLHFHFSLSCAGEGNGNPLQWSCLENPRDGGAWWAAVYRVAESDTTELTQQQQQCLQVQMDLEFKRKGQWNLNWTDLWEHRSHWHHLRETLKRRRKAQHFRENGRTNQEVI